MVRSRAVWLKIWAGLALSRAESSVGGIVLNWKRVKRMTVSSWLRGKLLSRWRERRHPQGGWTIPMDRRRRLAVDLRCQLLLASRRQQQLLLLSPPQLLLSSPWLPRTLGLELSRLTATIA